MDFNDPVVRMAITVVTSVLASSGFWAFLQHHFDRNDSYKKLLLGIAHDRIMYLGMQYIERGWITADEYENLHVYLYEPYHANGGNGSATRVMSEVDRLRIVKTPPIRKQ